MKRSPRKPVQSRKTKKLRLDDEDEIDGEIGQPNPDIPLRQSPGGG